MRIVRLFVFLLAINLILSACSSPNTDSTEKIVPPQNQLMSIKGTWEISNVLMTDPSNENEEENEKDWLSNKVQFSNSYMSLGESTLEGPEYQMKRVNADEYLLFNSKSLPVGFMFPNKEVEVITVIDQDKFFCEVLIIKEDELILKVQGNSFYLNKISDKVDEYVSSEIDNKKDQEINIQVDKEDLTRTGVLIGFRSQNENSSNNSEVEYNYRTLWISSNNNEINPILEMKNIYFPRRSGFWKIEMKKATEDNRSEEYILANNVSMEDNKAEIQLKNKLMRSDELFVEEDIRSELDFFRWGEKTGEVTRKINYVGNDYISVETMGKGEYIIGSESWEKSKLQLLPTDGLPNGSGVKISDILEESGVISMRSAWERIINYFAIDSPNILYREELLENFGIERKLGHWLLKGRINYIDKDKKFNIADYSISLIPPSEVVVYDTLFVPWTNIKDRVPRALDAYTSPNKDIAIVITRKELLIYDIIGNDLSRYPREKIDLKEEETVIMAEWATGHYVESWQSILQRAGK